MTPPASERRPAAVPSGRWFTGFLVVATIGLCVLVVILTRENRRLKLALAAAAQAHLPPDALRPGDAVLPLHLIAADGTLRTETFSGEAPAQTLVLLVGRHCPYCLDTIPRWDRLLKPLQGAGLRVIAIQSDAAGPEQLMPLPGTMPAHVAQNGATTWLRNIPTEPAAVLIDSGARVRATWFGIPTDAQLDELARAILDPK